MNGITSIQGTAMDGNKYYSTNALNNSVEKNANSTPIIVTPTGAQAAENLVQNAQEVKASAQELQQMSDTIMGRKLHFNVNKELGSIVVKVVDPTTDQVLKEIPSVDIQKLKIQIRKAIGLIFDELV